ncbi:hypothetical protein GLOIN_2v1778635 [Rhizophagus clarus]|uniref:Uncharacterized protein n=1 Tax=Rhizophagus clarus TaxID=94130 RepID=A0A8H3L3E4_9GLOM|nr:hypothetical protein GLOIN_2v1778635 [Rhizophagus clarus]
MSKIYLNCLPKSVIETLEIKLDIQDLYEKNCAITVEVNSDSTVKKFKKKIKKQVIEKLKCIYIGNDIRVKKVWNVTKNNAIGPEMVEGIIQNYWPENPSSNFIRVIATNSDRSKYFNAVEDRFDNEFGEFGKNLPLSAVNIGLVDNKETIIVFIYVSEEEPVYLPSKFEGFPVFVKYGVIFDLDHRSFHENLTSDKSICSSKNYAGTLGENMGSINYETNEDYSEDINYERVLKFGKSAIMTSGFIQDRMKFFYPPVIIKVVSLDEESGAHPYYYVIPINLIISDAKKRFDATFNLITQ